MYQAVTINDSATMSVESAGCFGFAKADVEQEACSVVFQDINLLSAPGEIVQENHQGSWCRQLAHSQLR